MPLYEYQCDTCGSVFEVRQKFSDEPLTVHESCGGSVRRLLSAPAFQFKGSGWYITDYARGGNGSSSSKANETKSETKAESKTDTASTSTPAKTSESK